MNDRPPEDRLPPPLPGEEAAAKRAENPIPEPDGSEPGGLRQAVKPVLIGVAVSIAIPIVLVIILAFVAQLVISSH